MILDRMMGRSPMRADVSWHPVDDRWYSADPGFHGSVSGVSITPDRAMRVSTVFACVSLLAETLASTPCMLLRRLDNGGKERAKDHPLYKALRYRPNRWMTAMDYFGYAQTHAGLRGNVITEIREYRNGTVELIPLHPDLVRPERTENGTLRYEVRERGGTYRTLTQDEVISVRDLSTDGLVGLARSTLAREAIAVATAEEQFAGGFFRNDASGRLVISHKGAPPGEEDRKKYLQTVRDNYAGVANTRRPLVLWQDATATEVGSHDDGRFIIEPRRYQATDVARFWRVPGILIGMEDRVSAWGTGIAEIKQGFLTLTMRAWYTRYEQALNTSLLTEEEQEEYFFSFELKDLLRGDLLARTQAMEIQRRNGVLSPNEWRIIEDMNPRPGGDVYQDNLQGAPANTPSTASTPPRRRQESADDEDRDDRAATTRLPLPLVQDAAARIAGMESQEFERRGEHAKREDLRAYAAKVIAPLAASFGGDAWVIDETVARIDRTAQPACDRSQRTTELALLIEETFRAGALVRRAAA